MLGKIFRLIWRTLTTLAAVLLLVIFIVLPLAVYFGVFYETPPYVGDNAVLVVRPSGALVEQRTKGLLSLVDRDLGAAGEPTVVSRVIKAIDIARRDDRVKKLYLLLDRLGGAQPGQIQDIVRAVDRFRKSGKPVIAWSDNYNQARYALASHADRITLDPMGGVMITGYGVYRNYFAEAIHDLGIEVHVFRHGKYKSFVEPFIRNSMSPAAEKANRAWTSSVWQTYREMVSARRSFGPEHIVDYVQGYADALADPGGSAAQLAKQAGLVDALATRHESLRFLDGPGEPNNGKLEPIGVEKYLAAVEAEESSSQKPVIARIVVAGAITSGGRATGAVDSQAIEYLFRQARDDDQVKGVLLRVNSPGGTIQASEAIRRQVVRTQAAGKPVVVSMAGVAASGGYWISMNAKRIWAEPSTITGSIGVFGILATASKPLNELGIHSDGIGTTPLSGLIRLNHPLSDTARKIVKSGIDFAYRQFVHKVAKARDMSIAEVKKHAKGRVWSGRDAKRIGLVDHLGGPVEATQALAGLAGLESGEYEVRTLTPPSTWDVVIRQFFSAHVKASLLPDWLTESTTMGMVPWFKHHLNAPRARYARCFCRITTASLDGAF